MDPLPMIVVADAKADFAHIQQQLQAHGLTQIIALPGLSMLRGLASPDLIPLFQSVSGVHSVELEGAVSTREGNPP